MRLVLVSSAFPSERMGGAEYQTLLITKGLVELGHEPLFLATNMENIGELEGDGFHIKTILGRMKNGSKKHAHQVFQIVKEFNPDVIYVRDFIEAGIFSSISQDLDIPMVSMSCHAMETSPILVGYHPLETIGHLRSGTTKAHFRSFLSIRSNAAHVCNTRTLQKKIESWYPQKTIQTIYNGSPIPPSESVHHFSSGQIIWVNNLKRWKRPDKFIKLAHALPKYRFVMVGRLSGGRTFISEINKKIHEAPQNFQYLGPLPIDRVNKLITKSDLLLYTSLPVEGFGNSFLQAWLRRVPTLSLEYDLDGILEREGIGCCATSFNRLVEDIEELMMDEKQRFEMGSRARKYAIQNHNPESMVLDYESLFKTLAAVN